MPAALQSFYRTGFPVDDESGTLQTKGHEDDPLTIASAGVNDVRIFLVIRRDILRASAAPAKLLDEIGGLNSLVERVLGIVPSKTVGMRIELAHRTCLGQHHRKSKAVAGNHVRSGSRQRCQQARTNEKSEITKEVHDGLSLQESVVFCNCFEILEQRGILRVDGSREHWREQ